ncbi:MAG: DUF692 family multinuclear iron-containing protein [Anaerolineae bacterium]
MMDFAINWSPEASVLLDAGLIEVDYYKCPDWPNLVADARTQRPSYVHFPLSIGIGQSPAWDFAEIEDWFQRTETRFVNAHIVPNTEQFSADIELDALAETLSIEVQRLVDAFGAERVIIENCPFFARNADTGKLAQSIEPALFHAIIASTGCGFLLDISHAYLVCDYLERDFEAYVNAMPVQHLRECHVTGVGMWSTGTFGDHMPLTAPDWQRFGYCADQMRTGHWRKPEVLAFEYGGIEFLRDLCGSDRDAIAEQAPRLYATVQAITNAD